MAAGRHGVINAVLAAAVLISVPASAEPRRPTLAIISFRAFASGRTLPPAHLCDTAAQLMLDRLVASGEYHVYDGQWLLQETDVPRGNAEAALRDAARAAGVDYIAFGVITRFSTEVQDRGLGGAGLRLPLVGGGHRRQNELVVSISMRVVDVRTGEVVTTAEGTGLGRRTSLRVAGLALIGAGGFGRSVLESRDAQIDEALRGSIESAARELVVAAPRLATNADSSPRSSR